MTHVKDIANRVVRYIGMDVHKDSTTAVVLDAQASLVMQVTLRTEGSVLVDFLRGLREPGNLLIRRAGFGRRSLDHPGRVLELPDDLRSRVQ